MATSKVPAHDWAQLEIMVREAKRKASTCSEITINDVSDSLEIVNIDNTELRWEVPGCLYKKGTNAVKTLESWILEHD